MTDRKTVMSWLECLAQDDWPRWHSDSEVQEIAKAALSMLKEQEAEIRQLRLALDIAKGTCNGINVEGR